MRKIILERVIVMKAAKSEKEFLEISMELGLKSVKRAGIIWRKFIENGGETAEFVGSKYLVDDIHQYHEVLDFKSNDDNMRQFKLIYNPTITYCGRKDKVAYYIFDPNFQKDISEEFDFENQFSKEFRDTVYKELIENSHDIQEYIVKNLTCDCLEALSFMAVEDNEKDFFELWQDYEDEICFTDTEWLENLTLKELRSFDLTEMNFELGDFIYLDGIVVVDNRGLKVPKVYFFQNEYDAQEACMTGFNMIGTLLENWVIE